VNEQNILIASVGGQGGLTLSRIMATAAVYAGFSVRTGETLGMAQRGGSVQSFVRIGREVRSPLFSPGEANVMLAFEAVEAIRSSPYLGRDALVLVDPVVKQSITTLTKKEKYPPVEALFGVLRERTSRFYVVNALREASKLGSSKSANVYMLGVYCSLNDLLPAEAAERSIRDVLGKNSADAMRVFQKGLRMGKKLAVPT
jgi:indolepyruvate ferredoxin oxidoreductase beta subunit